MRVVEAGEEKEKYLVNISQDVILKEIGTVFSISVEYLRRLLDFFWKTGEMLVRSFEKRRGRASPNYLIKYKINIILIQKVMDYCDSKHAEGYTLRRQMVVHCLQSEHDVKVFKQTITCVFKFTGFSYKTKKDSELSMLSASIVYAIS